MLPQYPCTEQQFPSVHLYPLPQDPSVEVFNVGDGAFGPVWLEPQYAGPVPQNPNGEQQFPSVHPYSPPHVPSGLTLMVDLVVVAGVEVLSSAAPILCGFQNTSFGSIAFLMDNNLS